MTAIVWPAPFPMMPPGKVTLLMPYAPATWAGAYPTPPGPSKSSCRNPLYPFDGTTMYCGSAFMSPERAESAACCAGVYLPGSVDADPEDEFVVGACPNVDGWPV